MGEIKSTLDIVMEKTKHLTLSDKEKQDRNASELKNKVKGLIQKFQDQILGMDQLKKEVAGLRETLGVDPEGIVFDEIYGRLGFGQDNGPLLSLLNMLFGTDETRAASIFQKYQEAVDALTRARLVEKKEVLAERHVISGPAIVPHLAADKTWQEGVQKIRQKFEAMLVSEKESLRG